MGRQKPAAINRRFPFWEPPGREPPNHTNATVDKPGCETKPARYFARKWRAGSLFPIALAAERGSCCPPFLPLWGQSFHRRENPLPAFQQALLKRAYPVTIAACNEETDKHRSHRGALGKIRDGRQHRDLIKFCVMDQLRCKPQNRADKENKANSFCVLFCLRVRIVGGL